MVIPIIPKIIDVVSVFDNFSLIRAHAIIAANMGPVVKLIVLATANGTSDRAVYLLAY